jgi:hypothetical protein
MVLLDYKASQALDANGSSNSSAVDSSAYQGLEANSSDSTSRSGGGGGSARSFYLGVAHYWEPSGKDGRAYKHFLIKVDAQPPFKVMQVKRESARGRGGWALHMVVVEGGGTAYDGGGRGSLGMVVGGWGGCEGYV